MGFNGIILRIIFILGHQQDTEIPMRPRINGMSDHGIRGKTCLRQQSRIRTEQLIFENGQASLRPRAREYTNEIDK